jgi:O-6-methylguanine DNA methyltransferase
MKKSSAIVPKFSVKPPATVKWGKVAAPVGPMLIGLTEEGAICRLHFMGNQKQGSVLKNWHIKWPRTKFIEDKQASKKAAQRIFGKTSRSPERINIDMCGTRFQQSVWKTLMTIPAGKVMSYADIARRIRKPNAARAVGNAAGANPVPILVPCHRVIASDGKIGGYSGGLAIKKRLLKQENIIISNS